VTTLFPDYIWRVKLLLGPHGYRVGTSGSSIVVTMIDGLNAGENAVAEKSVE
jgi:hypothetical protein